MERAAAYSSHVCNCPRLAISGGVYRMHPTEPSAVAPDAKDNRESEESTELRRLNEASALPRSVLYVGSIELVE